MVREGKIRYIGVSEPAVETVRRAHAVHPVATVQTEYSLGTRHVEPQLFPTLRELEIGFVPYSPLGRGLLTGKLDAEALEPDDFRRLMPSAQGEMGTLDATFSPQAVQGERYPKAGMVGIDG